MKKTIQKITLLFVLFIFSTNVSYAECGNGQCPIEPPPCGNGQCPAPPPNGFSATTETSSETNLQTSDPVGFPEYFLKIFETLNDLF